MATINAKTLLSAGRTAAALLSTYNQTVVGVFDPATGDQLFSEAPTMKANVNRSSKIMDHPLENGSPVSDYKIINPVEIDLGILVDTNNLENTYATISRIFEFSVFLTVQTNAGVFEDMVLTAMPSDESPDMWGMLVISLRLREVQLVTVQFQDLTASSVANPNDQSTINTGEQTATPVVNNSRSALYDLIFAPSKSGK
jgi:hypothetical protein